MLRTVAFLANSVRIRTLVLSCFVSLESQEIVMALFLDLAADYITEKRNNHYISEFGIEV